MVVVLLAVQLAVQCVVASHAGPQVGEADGGGAASSMGGSTVRDSITCKTPRWARLTVAVQLAGLGVISTDGSSGCRAPGKAI